MEPLEQTSYDVVVLGTGITESIIAAACARVGKTVLHLDRNDYYGGASATFTSKDLFALVAAESQRQASPPTAPFASTSPTEIVLNNDHVSSIFGHFEAVQSYPGDANNEAILGRSRSYSLDLAPQLIYCRGPLVELLISSDVGRYLEYKALERVYTEEADGTFLKVPFSKEDVFLSNSVGVVEKRRLMKFLTFCLEYEAHPDQYLEQQDLPFTQYLEQKQITGYLAAVIRFAISLDLGGDVTTLTGLKRVREHLLSLGRYGNTAFLWPMYGVSETSQAFCRLSAIFGGIYMLRCRPHKFTLAASEKTASQRISHITVEEGQTVESRYVVSNLDYLPTSSPATATSVKFSRATVIVDRILHQDTLVDLTVIPPNRFGNPHAVYLIHSDHHAGSSPEGKSVIYLSTVASGASARADLQAVVDAHFATEEAPAAAVDGEVTSEPSTSIPATSKPRLLYSLYYTQQARELSWETVPENLFTVPDAGTNIVWEDSVRVARDIFQRMFPGEEFLPPTPRPEEALSVEAILAEEAPAGSGFDAPHSDQ